MWSLGKGAEVCCGGGTRGATRYHCLPYQEVPRPDALEEKVSGQTVAGKAEGQLRCAPGEAGMEAGHCSVSIADPESKVSLEVMRAERMCPIKFNLNFSS